MDDNREFYEEQERIEKEEILQDAYDHAMDIDPCSDSISLNEIKDEEFFFVNARINERAK